MNKVAVFFLLFVLIHSITVAVWFKHLCRRVLGDIFMRVYYRALYNAISFITAFVAIYFIYRAPDRVIWTAPLLLRWVMHAIQIGGLAFGARAFEYLDTGEFMGITQIRRYFTRREVAGNIEGLTGKKLVTTGVYGIVRHPMYLAGIVIFTFNPHITVNGLTITVLADLYFLLGMFIEERRFLKIFGNGYREYMDRVPRFIPKLHDRGRFGGNGKKGLTRL
ncbi:MAG: methyltransferase family protein [Betaproteobacteria bacterium]